MTLFFCAKSRAIGVKFGPRFSLKMNTYVGSHNPINVHQYSVTLGQVLEGSAWSLGPIFFFKKGRGV